MQDSRFPLPLIRGFERQLERCLQGLHRVPLDARGWNEWRIVEHELIRAVRCLQDLRRMAEWVRVGAKLSAENDVRRVQRAPFCVASAPRVSGSRSRAR